MRERMRAKDIRAFAKEKLKENLKVLVLIEIIFVIINGGIIAWATGFQRLLTSMLMVFLIQVAEMFLFYAFFTGVTAACFKSSRGMKPKVEDAFYAFHGKAKPISWVILRKCIMIQLYAAAFGFVVGIFEAGGYFDVGFLLILTNILAMIIVELRYFPAIYLLIDGQEKESKKAVWRGLDLMKKNYMRLILLYLSFIPWMLLGILTVGIGLFIVGPWMQVSMAVFYSELLEQEKLQLEKTTEKDAGQESV